MIKEELVETSKNLVEYVIKDNMENELFNFRVSRDKKYFIFLPKEKQTYDMCLEIIKEFPDLLFAVREDLLDENICMLAYEKDVSVIEYIPSEFISYDMMIKLVKKDYRNIMYLRDDLKTEKFIEDVIKISPKTILYFKDIKISNNIILELIENNIHLFWYLINRDCLLCYKNDILSLFTENISKNPLMISIWETFRSRYALQSSMISRFSNIFLKNSPEFKYFVPYNDLGEYAISNNFFKKADSWEEWNGKNIIKFFTNLPENLQNKLLIEQALEFPFGKSELINFFKYIRKDLQTFEMALYAVSRDNNNYVFLNDELKKDSRIIYAAILQNKEDIYEHIPKDAITADILEMYLAVCENSFVKISFENIDNNLLNLAIMHHSFLLKEVSSDRQTYAMCLKSVKNSGINLEYVDDKFKTLDLLSAAFSNDSYSVSFFKNKK